MALIQLLVNGSDTAPFVKAAIRDVKAYRQSKNYRDIPVGYSGGMQLDLLPSAQQWLPTLQNTG